MCVLWYGYMEMGEIQVLTPRQSQYVDVGAWLYENDKFTYAKVAEKLGVTRQTAHEALTKPDTSKALQKRISERSDKARGLLKDFQRIAGKLSANIERLEFDPENRPEVVVGAFKVLAEAESKARETQARFGLEDDDHGAKVDAYKKKMAQAVRVGRYLAEREQRRNRAICAKCGYFSTPPPTE